MRKLDFYIAIALLLFCSSCVNLQNQNFNAENNTNTPTLSGFPTTTDAPSDTITPPTIDATLIPSQEILPTHDSFFSTHVIVVKEFETRDLIAYDLISGFKRQLNPDSDTYFSEISWEGDGCEILVSSQENGFLGINLDGTILERIPSVETNNFSLAYASSLSSDNQYLAYLVQVFDNEKFKAKGGYLMTLTVNDLYIQSTFDPDELQILSKNSSVTEYEWSNFDNLVAYTDLDSNGIHQLFISDPSGGQKRQLSLFTNEYSLVKHITWSPDNNSLAFIYTIMEDENVEEDLRHLDQLFVSENLDEPKLLEIQTKFKIINKIIFIENNNLVIYGNEKDGSKKIILLNTDSMEEKTLFPDKEIISFSYPILYNPDNGIGFFIFGNEYTFATYNIPSGIIKYYPVNIQGFQSFFGPPKEYAGEKICVAELEN